MNVPIEFTVPGRKVTRDLRTLVTVALKEDEYQALRELCVEQDMTDSGIMRQALRIYQLVHRRTQEGYTMHFLDDAGKPYPTFSKINLDLNETSHKKTTP